MSDASNRALSEQGPVGPPDPPVDALPYLSKLSADGIAAQKKILAERGISASDLYRRELEPVTIHHTMTMEWADYPSGRGEITACFCSCGWKPEGLRLTVKPGDDEVPRLANEFYNYVLDLRKSRSEGVR